MSTKSTSTRRFAVSSIASGSIVAAVIRQVQIFSDATYVTLLDETKVNNAGGYIQIIGIGFQPGCVVYFNNTLLSSTFISSTVVRATTPAVSNGSYVLLVANSLGTSNNASAIYVLTTSGFPTWTQTAYNSSSVTVSVQLLATGDAPLTYTLQSGSSLPDGTTLSSSGLLSGTIIGATNGIVYSFVVLVDDVDLQTTQATISLTIAFSDTYYKNVTLLLNGETAVTPFIQDASTNNFNSTIAGDTRPTLFIPYQNGYYSNYFDGTGDYLTVPDNTAFALGTSNFTIEGWFYLQTLASAAPLIAKSAGTNATSDWAIFINVTSGTLRAEATSGSSYIGQCISTVGVTINTWNHFAWVRSGSNFVLYLNGVSVATATSASSAGNGTANLVRLGADNGYSGGTFTGYMSNMRIVKGVAVYTGNFTPPTTPLTATQSSGTNISAITESQTSFLSCQSNRFIDNSLNNFTITKNGDTTVQIFNPFGITTSVTVNNVYSTYLGGTDGRLTVPAGTAFAYGTSDFTAEGWFLVSDMTASSLRIIFSQTVSGTNYFVMGPQSSGVVLTGKIAFTGVGSGSGTEILSGSNLFTAGTWNHFAVCRVSGTVTVYLNGLGGTPTVNTTDFSNTSYVPTIGGYTHGTTQNFSGYVSNLRVVKGVAVYTSNFTPATSNLTSTQSVNVNGNPSAAITGAQTSLLTCQNSTLIDNSSYVLTITPLGQSQPINSTTPFTQTTTAVALTTLGGTYFDGTGDYLSVPDSTAFTMGAGDFTLEAWVYLTTSGVSRVIFGTCDAAGTQASMAYTLYVNASNNLLFGVGYSGTMYYSTNTATVPTNQWVHVAGVRNGANVYAYLNGVQSTTNTNMGSLSITDSSQIIGIGRNGAYNGEYVTGYISNARIVKGTAVYTSNFAPPVQPLTAVTNTSLLTLQYNGGANNSGIIDNSAFNNILTRFGNTSQGTFTPFSQTGWSTFIGYGAYGYQNLPANTGYDVTGADFTIEFWANFSTWNTMGSSGMTVLGNFISTNGWYVSWNGGVGANLSFSTYNGGAGSASIVSTGITAGTNFQLGTWNHFTLMQKTSVIYFYLNGSMTYSTAAPAAVGVGQTMYIGVYAQNFTYAGNPYFYYSNLRIVKGTGLYSTAGFTPPTTPLTPIAGTTLLLGQSSNLVDNSGINAPITNTVSGVAPSSQALSPFGSILPATSLSYSNYFDGTGDRLTVPANTAFAFGTGDFTIECWVYLSAYNGFYGSQIAGGHTYSVGADYLFIVNTTGKLFFQIGTSAVGAITSISSVSLNVWTHIALVRISGAVAFYINGVNAGGGGTYSTSVANTIVYSIAGDSAGSGATMLTGSISNHRTVKGTGVYTGNFTPPTSPLTATQSAGANISAITGVQTSLLTCQSTTIIDNSTNAFTITVTGDTVPRNFNPFGYTAQTNVTYTPSVNGGSIYFDGTGDYLSIPTSSPFNSLYSTTVSFTLEFWMYPTYWTSTTEYTILTGSQTANTTVGFRIYYKAGVVTWYANNVEPAVTQTVPLNQWSHLAFVWNGTNITTYVNGGTKKTAASTWTNTPGNVNYISILLPGTYNFYYFGYLSSLRLVSGAALYTNTFIPSTTPFTSINNTTSTTTMLLNFTSGGIIDYHSSNVVETVGNAQLNFSIKKFGNASMSFDGTTDALFQPSNVNYGYGTGDFTIEFWLYLNATTQQSIVSNLSGAAGVSPHIYYENAAGIRYYTNSANRITGSALSTGIWYHIAVSRASGSTRMFINGTQTGSTYTDANNYGTANPLGVGDYAIGTSTLNGYIDDLRITKGFARYTANFNTSPPVSPATAFLTQ